MVKYIDFSDIDNFEDNGDFEGFENFKKFLEDNGVLDEFVRNFYNFEDDERKRKYWRGYDGYSGKYTLNDYLTNNKKYREKSYIDDAFDWSYSPEGFDFWNNIDDKWRYFLSHLSM
jgi:hypothetical protein